MPTIPKCTDAGLRILLWCSRTGASIYWNQAGSAWTEDDYRWPVATSMLDGLISRGAIELHPQQKNHGRRYCVRPDIAEALRRPPPSG